MFLPENVKKEYALIHYQLKEGTLQIPKPMAKLLYFCGIHTPVPVPSLGVMFCFTKQSGIPFNPVYDHST